MLYFRAAVCLFRCAEFLLDAHEIHLVFTDHPVVAGSGTLVEGRAGTV